MRANSSFAIWTLLLLSSVWAVGSLFLGLQWQFLCAAALAGSAAVRLVWPQPVEALPVELPAIAPGTPQSTALPDLLLVPAPERQAEVVRLRLVKPLQLEPAGSDLLTPSLSA
ncbi:MAG: hypothetical protein L0G87_13295 [Renibacterium salmoninarum]|nr:hypothetical protein [Renibacterium salmoninarum]